MGANGDTVEGVADGSSQLVAESAPSACVASRLATRANLMANLFNEPELWMNQIPDLITCHIGVNQFLASPYTQAAVL